MEPPTVNPPKHGTAWLEPPCSTLQFKGSPAPAPTPVRSVSAKNSASFSRVSARAAAASPASSS